MDFYMPLFLFYKTLFIKNDKPKIEITYYEGGFSAEIEGLDLSFLEEI